MAHIKSLKDVIEITVDGSDAPLRFDVSDERFKNNLLKLLKKWRDLGVESEKKYAEFANIEDDLDRLIAKSDYEIELFEDYKNDWNRVFGMDIVSAFFGDITPSATRYAELIDAIAPYVTESVQRRNEKLAELNKKYGFVEEQPERTEI